MRITLNLLRAGERGEPTEERERLVVYVPSAAWDKSGQRLFRAEIGGEVYYVPVGEWTQIGYLAMMMLESKTAELY